MTTRTAGDCATFAFPFYGNNFNSVRVHQRLASFTSALTTFTNTALRRERRCDHAREPGRGVLGPTFQVLLYPSGTIDFQYQSMQGTRLNEATIGIQNATKDVGTQVVFNASYVKDDLRVRFSRAPGWVTVSPASGTVAAGAPPDTVYVSCNATGLADGDYAGQVRITSNDLDEGLTTVPVNLHVGVATAGLDVNPNTLNRNSNGNFVSIAVTPPNPILPPSPILPEQILTSSLLLQRSLPVDPQGPVSYEDGIAYYKFDRATLLEILPEGESIPIELDRRGRGCDLARRRAVRLPKLHFSIFTRTA